MKVREVIVPYLLQEIDYNALRQAIETAFTEEYGGGMVEAVRVAHFNPDVIDVTVVVRAREVEMDDLALALSETFRRQGVRVAVRVTANESHSAEV